MRNYVKEMEFIMEKKNSVLNFLSPLFSGLFFIAYSGLIFFNEYSFSFYVLTVPLGLAISLYPAFKISLSGKEETLRNEIKSAREFLEEAGQEATNKNINILMDRYYRGGWQKIEDMLYETRRVPLAENMELISGNVNQNLKEALPAKQD